MRQEVARRVEYVNLPVAVGDADVDVQPEDEQGARDHLQLLDEERVVRVVGNLLLAPVGDRVGRGGDDGEPLLARERGDDGAQVRDVGARLPYVAADARADLNLRLDHLRLHLLAEDHPALFEYFGEVRAQLTRLRVNDLKLLLDAERVLFWRHLGFSACPLERRAPGPQSPASAASMKARSSSERPWKLMPTPRPGLL